MRYCEKCGSEIPKGAKFCEKCGALLESDSREGRESHFAMKRIFGGIAGGIVVVAVVVLILIATGILGGNGADAPGGDEETIRTSTDGMQSIPGTAVPEATAQPTEQPTAEPTAAPARTPDPTSEATESPVIRDGADESDAGADHDVPENDNGENSEYIFPNSDSEYLTSADVKGLSASKINLAKNELYARHGRKFEREDLQKYFEGRRWYNPIYTAKEWDEYGDSYFFNEYEIKNRNLLKKWENKKKK